MADGTLKTYNSDSRMLKDGNYSWAIINGRQIEFTDTNKGENTKLVREVIFVDQDEMDIMLGDSLIYYFIPATEIPEALK